DEAEDLAGGVVSELRDGQVLDDPLLDLLEVVVVLVENGAGSLQVEVVLRRLAPGERRDPVEVSPDHAVLGGRRRQLLEPGQLAVDGLADVLRQVEGRPPLAQLVRPGLFGAPLAKPLRDRLQLLPQAVLARALLHLGRDLRLDLRAELYDLGRGSKIQSQVQSEMEKGQREYFLRQQ